MARENMPDTDTLDWRESMISWAEATHREVSSIRRMISVFFWVWAVFFVLGLVALFINASNTS
jgi:hypothetical protein